MIKTLLFVALATLVVAGSLWLAEYPGDVQLSAGSLQIDVPLPIFALCLLLFAVIAALLYRMWRGLRGAPRGTRAYFTRRNREKGYRALTQGMVAVAAGDAGEASRQARKADSLLKEPPLTMLLSAQAAQLDGDDEAAKRYFTAMLEREETAFLGLRGLLMQAQRDGHHGEALTLAHRARALRPKTPWVLTTLLELQIEGHHWREALNTLDEAVRRKAIDADKAGHDKAVLLLACSQVADDAKDADEALSFARKAHAQKPDFLPATLRFAALSAASGKKRQATKIIEEGWAKTPHGALATLYGALDDSADPLKRVKRLEKLAALNADHPESHMALAEALMAAKIWGAARAHLEKAGGETPPARVCKLMAQLEEGEHGNMDSARSWLLRATLSAPDPTWICGGCGAASRDWTPTCARCDALGTLQWRIPERALILEDYSQAPASFLPPPTVATDAPSDMVPLDAILPPPPDIKGSDAPDDKPDDKRADDAPTSAQR
ncbi:MAG: heme biosynthesis protein HemY [Rhodospirillaceae bacterium]|jgi:HemY protein|nr:heme biosynthesis protein HemY [Rhodospirillaceae bacterium]MBT5458716.1 heme biosynthesis protein HemY [Rhodospirillaceae bacterium]